MFYLISLFNDYYFSAIKFPWAINVVFAAIPFFAVGYYWGNEVFLRRRLFMLVFAIASAGMTYSNLNLNYNMKYSSYGIPFLSFFVALSGIVVLKELSEILVKNKTLASVFTYIGSASMVIMYLHQFIQLSLRNYDATNSYFLRVTLAIAISLLVYAMIQKFSVLRALLLGSYADFEKLTHRFTARQT